MTTNTSDLDVDRRRARHRITGRVTNLAGFEFRFVVQRDREIRFRNFGVNVVAQHRIRAVAGFFRRLAQTPEPSTPATLQLGQHLRRPEKTRHVYVVTTRMHHADFQTRVVPGLHVARIRKTCFLFDRESIELGPDEYGWSRTIFQHTNNAVANPLLVLILADAFSNCESEFAQLARHEGRRLFLAMRELRRCVRFLVSRQPRRDVAIDHGVERLSVDSQYEGENTQ